MKKKSITRAHLVEKIHVKLGYSRAESGSFIDLLIKEINVGLKKDGLVKISSFGTLQVRRKKQRIGRNPKTKKEVPISARNVVSFYASNNLKNSIKN